MYISGKMECGHSPGEQILHLKAGPLWLTSSPKEKELRFSWHPEAFGLFLSPGLDEGK
jgi:hypothetical protein